MTGLGMGAPAITKSATQSPRADGYLFPHILRLRTEISRVSLHSSRSYPSHKYFVHPARRMPPRHLRDSSMTSKAEARPAPVGIPPSALPTSQLVVAERRDSGDGLELREVSCS